MRFSRRPDGGGRRSSRPSARPTVLIAHPSADVYGADLQMLQSASAMLDRGWRVVVVVPDDGKLVPSLEERGAEVRLVRFPVLRRANASAGGMMSLGCRVAATLPRLLCEIQAVRPDLVYVNTVTIPWWLLAGRAAHTPVICHVHEAEAEDSRAVSTALNLPLLAANSLITISRPATEAIGLVRLRARAHLIYNGVPQPEIAVQPPPPHPPFRLAVVGRLSPRKAPHVALEAVGLVRSRGREVTLDVCGTSFAGYEWYERQLRDRACRPDLEGAVRFTGYVSPIWSALARVNAVLAPSVREPFGNAVVEAQLARRPVVAAAAMGHLETVFHERTGLLVPPDDAEAMAAAIERLMDDGALCSSLVAEAQTRAVQRFSLDRYREEVADLVSSVAGRA